MKMSVMRKVIIPYTGETEPTVHAHNYYKVFLSISHCS